VHTIYESAEAVAFLLPNFVNVSALLTLCVCFFGWLAAITLDDYDQDNAEGQAVNDGFGSLGEGIYTMFFVASTANFPDQMLPAFTRRAARVRDAVGATPRRASRRRASKRRTM